MKRILIVDDDQDVLIMVEYVLSLKGYKVDVLQNPEMLPQVLMKFSPDLILLDVHVGKHSGFDICKTITASISAPIVILFSASNISDEDAKKYGASSHITKPFKTAALYARLDMLLESKAF